MAAFVQIIQWKTSKIDEIEKLQRAFAEQRSARSSGPGRVQVLADKDNPGTYYTVVEFPSAEVAAENNARPETTEFATKMAELCDGPPTFHNTEVLHDEVMS